MDKKEASQETQSQKNPDKRKKSASGIWAWILWLLFTSAVIVVFIASQSGKIIWDALTGKPDHGLVTAVPPEGGHIAGDMSPIRDNDIRPNGDVPDGSSSW